MKKLLLFLMLAVLFANCAPTASVSRIQDNSSFVFQDTIRHSLFSNKSNISEENIQKILDGTYHLPSKLRVAIVKIDKQRNYYWNDEDYIKNQQAYMDTLSKHLMKNEKVTKVFMMPEILIAKDPDITSLREASVRTQADVLLILSVSSDIYTKYKVFGKSEIKAFATTQVLLLDTRTGLIPFTQIVTKDFLSQKEADDLSFEETRKRIENEAVKLTIQDVGLKVNDFLK